MCVEQGVRNLSIWLKKFCMIFRGDNTAYCVLFAFELLSCIKNNKELGGLGWNAEYHPFFFFFIFSAKIEGKTFFPSPCIHGWAGKQITWFHPSHMDPIGSNWSLYLMNGGYLSILSLTTENLQIQILCQTWLSSLAQTNLNSHMTQQYECH